MNLPIIPARLPAEGICIQDSDVIEYYRPLITCLANINSVIEYYSDEGIIKLVTKIGN